MTQLRLHTAFVCALTAHVLTGPANEATGAPIRLAAGGKAHARIALADSASIPEQTAAKELAHYLHRVCGARFEILSESKLVKAGSAVYVGPTDFARARGIDTPSLGAEEFVIRTVGNQLIIAGGRPRGTLYGVYVFLEDVIGCRWFTFFDEEYVPRRSELTIPPLDRRGKPAFAFRDLYCPIWCDFDAKRRFMVRNRLNGHSSLASEDHGGRGSTYVGGGVHTFYKYVPPSQFFDAHPEYFSLRGGKRLSANGQLCFTTPELQRTMAARVLAKVAATQSDDPALRVYSVSVTDHPGMCDCKHCAGLAKAEGSHAGPLLQLVNTVAKRVERDHPDVLVDTLAYRLRDTERPPKTTRPRRNVLIRLCPIDSNFAEPFDHESNRHIWENLQGWSDIAANLWVWYYPVTYGEGSRFPLANLRRWGKDFTLMRDRGVTGLFVEGDAGHMQMHDLADLKTWILAKLMWDPDRDVDGLVQDFCDHFYGRASGCIQEYLRRVEAAGQQARCHLTWRPFMTEYTYLTGEFLLGSQRLFDEAERAVEEQPEIWRRVRRARMSTDFASLVFASEVQAAAGEQDMFSLADVTERYRRTWYTTVEARIQKGRQPSTKKTVNDLLGIWGVERQPKPLPPPLADLPADRVRQTTTEFFSICQAKPVRNADAATGLAARLPTRGEFPLMFGLYDRINRAFIARTGVKAGDINDPGYGLYRLGRLAVPPGSYIWITNSWRIQIPVGFAHDTARPDQQWDIYVSLKLTGPTYPHGGADDEDAVWVDRVILVKPLSD